MDRTFHVPEMVVLMTELSQNNLQYVATNVDCLKNHNKFMEKKLLYGHIYIWSVQNGGFSSL